MLKEVKTSQDGARAKIAVKRTHVYTIHITFLAPHMKSKFNPLTSMHTFFKEMIKYDSTITIIILNDTKHIALSTDTIPAMEEEFTKFFTIDTETSTIGNKSQVIVGCHITSNHMLHEIKFDSMSMVKFMDWLKKEKIYVDSDSLGVKKTATIRYLMKLHTHLTNCSTLKELLD